MKVKEPEAAEVQTVHLGATTEATEGEVTTDIEAGLASGRTAQGNVLADALSTLSSEHGKKATAFRAAAPMYPSTYSYWNVYAAGPYNWPFGANITAPNVRPNKVVSVGENVLFFVNLWANPNFDPAGMNNGPAQLAEHTLKIDFQVNNLTTLSIAHHDSGTVGDGGTFIDYGVAPWAENSLCQFTFVAPSIGPKPEMMEALITVDMVGTALPYAGYPTWVWDPDREPGVPVPYIDVSEPGNPVLLGNLPAVLPGWRYEIPIRFMVADPTN